MGGYLRGSRRAGRGTEAPTLGRALAAMQAGDVLVVWKIDRVRPRYIRRPPQLLRAVYRSAHNTRRRGVSRPPEPRGGDVLHCLRSSRTLFIQRLPQRLPRNAEQAATSPAYRRWILSRPLLAEAAMRRHATLLTRDATGSMDQSGVNRRRSRAAPAHLAAWRI